MEKLATQVIKNLQVKVSSIHIRYEDDVSINEAQAQIDLQVQPPDGRVQVDQWKAAFMYLFSVLAVRPPAPRMCGNHTV